VLLIAKVRSRVKRKVRNIPNRESEKLLLLKNPLTRHYTMNAAAFGILKFAKEVGLGAYNYKAGDFQYEN
jgi:hypothetical protein